MMVLSRALAAIAVLSYMLLNGSAPPTAVAGAVPCVGIESSIFVPITGTLGEILIDDSCQHVYATNTTFNRVEDFSLTSRALLAPIQVGSMPAGLDLTPNGDELYVANSGGGNISLVDLGQRRETQRFLVLPALGNTDQPFSIAIASNGLALFTTTTDTLGFGRVMQLNLTSGQSRQRTDFSTPPSTTGFANVRASADRGRIGVAVGNTSSGDVFLYDSATDRFSARRLNRSITALSLDGAGSTILINASSRAYVLDASLNVSGTVPSGTTNSAGVSIDRAGNFGYRSSASGIEVLDTRTFLVTDRLDLVDTVDNARSLGKVGFMDISADGRLLAVITDHGISIVRTNVAFTDDPLGPGVSTIRALHITELRSRIDAARTVRGLLPFHWTDISLDGGVPFKARHILDLRAAVTEAYVVDGVSPPAFTDPDLVGVGVKAVHIAELRAAVLALQ